MADLTPALTPEKDWKPVFLTALAEYGNILKAAKRAKISRTRVYQERDADPDFAAAWEVAKKIGTEALEDEARLRAYEGRLKPVYQGGKRVGSVREYSDTLLIFLLKTHKPEQYRDSSRVLTITVTPDDLAGMDDDDLDELERKLTSPR